MSNSYKVAYLGPEATYTHQATQSVFQDPGAYKLLPHTEIADVFTAVQDGTVDFGVVPYENLTNGPVSFTLNLFADREHRFPDVHVCAKTQVAVRHCLLGRKSSQPEGFGHIKTLYSHHQVWGQCTKFLAQHFQNVRREEISSTSKAAETVAADRTGEVAAISSPLVASLYGLDVFATDIQDREDNVTYFFILCNVKNTGAQLPLNMSQDLASSDSSQDPRTWSRWRSLITFAVPHDAPGAMADVLQVFRNHAINLENMHQCPRALQEREHVFCAEIQRPHRDEEPTVAKELGEVVKCRWLGNWLELRP